MANLKFDPDTYGIILEAKVKNRFAEITHLVLDTGSTYVMINWKLAVAIKLRITQDHTVQLTSANTLETVPKVIIPEITVLGKSIQNVEAIVKDLPPEAPADGLLGLSFLKYFKLTIDFKKGFLELV
ncbi:clan AA aspartic protease [Candidatus Daviesbacteria bacterium]|nr:clan AA aspartic protease [Candidatus Daviesbacteria bacterium]